MGCRRGAELKKRSDLGPIPPLAKADRKGCLLHPYLHPQNLDSDSPFWGGGCPTGALLSSSEKWGELNLPALPARALGRWDGRKQSKAHPAQALKASKQLHGAKGGEAPIRQPGDLPSMAPWLHATASPWATS